MTIPGPRTACAALGSLLLLGALVGPPAGARPQERPDPEPEPHIFFERFTFDPADRRFEEALEAAGEYCLRMRRASSDHEPLVYSSPIGGSPQIHVLAASPTSLALRDAYLASIRDQPSMESWGQLASMASACDDSIWVPVALEPRSSTFRGTTIVLRTFQARAGERFTARDAAVALGDHVNRTYESVHARLYEQSIGEVATYHWLFHVADYQVWLAAERKMAADERYRELSAALYSRCREGARTRLLLPRN